MCETFYSPVVYLAVQAALSITHVIDTGDGISSSVPVHDGYAFPGAVVRLDLGGRLKRVPHEASV